MFYICFMTSPDFSAQSSPSWIRRWRYVIILPLVWLLTGGLAWQGYAWWNEPQGNRLSDEISPYLQLHAHNPVDWYPWGPEAIDRARREHKPIFLSIGYSTCYWCHVMERKVFSNPDIAAVMNEHFINIKVDREERPDLDEVYMTATQLMTQGGGWPNSVFLTPDLEPFYAGTYFPPEDLPGRPGFPRILDAMNTAWQDRRDYVTAHAGKVAQAIQALQRDLFVSVDSIAVDGKIIDISLERLNTRYDAQNGGFGGAPKFPPAMRLELLLFEYRRTGDEKHLAMVTHTLDVMMHSGVYDHIGGGFHRYATDSKWRIPHFEKMLYNQADLARVYLLAYVMTQNNVYRLVAEDILSYVVREMIGEDGAFFSAMDSETDAIEGQYYLWTEEEIHDVLEAKADLFFRTFSLAPMPEGEGAVVYMSRSLEETASEVGIATDKLRQDVQAMKARFLTVRAKRKKPLVDTKVLTAWNGHMIDTFAYAALVTGKTAYRDIAIRAADFLLTHLRDSEGTLRRLYLDGQTKHDGFQEDYAYLIRGLTRLYRTTDDRRWLTEARTLTDRMLDIFWDGDHGGFYFTDDQEKLIVRTKNPYDGARPSGNAMAAHALLELSRYTEQPMYRERARQLFKGFAGQMKENSGRFTFMMSAVHDYLYYQDLQTGRIQTGMQMANLESSMDLLRTQTPKISALNSGAKKIKASLSTSPVSSLTDGVIDATLAVHVDADWHLNANPASMRDLIPTSVTFNSDVPIEVISVTYPEGKEVRFAFADQPLSVYEGELVIRARLRIKAKTIPDGTQIHAVITYQACSDEVCLAPDELIMSGALR